MKTDYCIYEAYGDPWSEHEHFGDFYIFRLDCNSNMIERGYYLDRKLVWTDACETTCWHKTYEDAVTALLSVGVTDFKQDLEPVSWDDVFCLTGAL
jgi:hypothetical protein